MLLPTILLVDNIEHVLNALRDRLEPKGFRVLQARNAQEAHQYCREEVIHLAVIDIRLEDEYDPADLSGLLLADDLDPFLPKIILTGHEHKDWATLMRRVLGPNP